MSVFEQFTLSPSAVASFTEPTPDMQRNYRIRDMMDGYGKSEASGRWKYSLRDLVGIWISDRLSQRGQAMDRRDALRIGRYLAPDVVAAFLAFREGRTPANGRFALTINDGYSETGRVFGSSLDQIHDAGDLNDGHEFDEAKLYDVWRLARTMPKEIAGLLIAAYEGEKES